MNGVPFDVLATPDELLERIDALIACGQPHVVRFLATHPVVLAKRDERYRNLLAQPGLNLADGIGPVLAARLRGKSLSRLSGTEGMRAVIRHGTSNGMRHYLFGGSPDVVARLRERLTDEYDADAVVGFESPPFRPLSDEEWRSAAARMRAANTDVVWVGLGAPKQDYAAAKLEELAAVPVIVAVGAAFDFIAGSKRRAPVVLRKLGLEWLYRLLQEPRRLGKRYVVGNLLFLYDVLVSAVTSRRNPGDRTTAVAGR